jgi:hypothetical protein
VKKEAKIKIKTNIMTKGIAKQGKKLTCIFGMDSFSSLGAFPAHSIDHRSG